MENEIDLSDTLEETIENIMGKKSHVWVTLGKGDHKIKVKVLIDTGNTIKEETAITEDLHNKLNVGLKEMGGVPIGTANKDGPKLRKFGVSKPIQMEISGIKGRFEVQPAVVSAVSDPYIVAYIDDILIFTDDLQQQCLKCTGWLEVCLGQRKLNSSQNKPIT